MLKEELEFIIKSDNGWAGISTLVLAIGIAGEYVLLPRFTEDDKPSRLRKIFRLRRPTEVTRILKAWHKALKITFAVLVVAGVSGEYEFSSRIARNADRLQDIADQQLANAAAIAAEAEVDAGVANKVAGVANREAAQLRRDAEGLRKRAEDEAQARVRIEQQLAWRTVTPDQVGEMRSVLAPLPIPQPSKINGWRIAMTYLNGDPEAEKYSDEIGDALHSFGAEIIWASGEVRMSVGRGRTPQGVFVEIRNRNQNDVRGAAVLVPAFKAAGIDLISEPGDGVEENAITIFVGTKPHTKP